MSPEILLLTLTLASAPVAPASAAGASDAQVPASQGVSNAPALVPEAGAPVGEASVTEASVVEASVVEASVSEASVVEASVAEATEAAVASSAVEAQADEGEFDSHGAPLPLASEQEAEGSPAGAPNVVPHVSVVPSRAVPVKWAGIGFTAVGIASYLGGQLVMDAADRMPGGPTQAERSDFGRSLRGGGLGAVITGVSIWLISNELARWEEAPTVGFVPVRDGGAVTFSVRLP